MERNTGAPAGLKNCLASVRSGFSASNALPIETAYFKSALKGWSRASGIAETVCPPNAGQGLSEGKGWTARKKRAGQLNSVGQLVMPSSKSLKVRLGCPAALRALTASSSDSQNIG
jgi:hypothetical protein